MSKRASDEKETIQVKQVKQDESLLEATIKALNEEPPLVKFLIPAASSPGDKDLTHDTAKKIVFSVDDEGRVCVYALWDDGTAATIVLYNVIIEKSGFVSYKEGRVPSFVTIVTEKIVSLGCLSYRTYDTFRPARDSDDAKDPRVAAMFEDKDCLVVNLGAGSQNVYVSLPPLDPQARKELREKAAVQPKPLVIPDLKTLLGGEEAFGGYNDDDMNDASFDLSPPVKVNGRDVCGLVVDLHAGTAEFTDKDGEIFSGVLGPVSVILDDKKAAEAKKANWDLADKIRAAAMAKVKARPLKGAKVSIKKAE